MKTILLILALIVFCQSTNWAQKPYDKDLIFEQNSLSINIQKVDDHYKAMITNAEDDTKKDSFNLKEFELEGFVFKFKKAFEGNKIITITLTGTEGETNKQKLETLATKCFYEATAILKQDTTEEAFAATKIKVAKTVFVCYTKSSLQEQERVEKDGKKEIPKIEFDILDCLSQYKTPKRCLSCKRVAKRLNKTISIINKKGEDKVKNAVWKKYAKRQQKFVNTYPASADTLSNPMFVDEVSLEFRNGFIENVLVKGRLKGSQDTLLRFTNIYGIGVSSKHEIDQLKNTRLYAVKELTVRKDSIIASKKVDKNLYILLGDVLDYDYFLNLSMQDFSPENQVVNIKKAEDTILYKPKLQHLIEAAVFTDFTNLWDSDKPNGLVQTEARWRFNINTMNSQFSRRTSLTLWEYGQVSATWSKIEQNNRRLITLREDKLDTNNLQITKQRIITPYQVLQYQYFSTGFSFNCLGYSSQNYKSYAYLNFGVRVGQTAIQDSIVKFDSTINNITTTGFVENYNILSVQIYPELLYKIVSHPIIDAHLLWRPSLILFAHSQPDLLVKSYNKDNLTFKTKRWNVLHLFELNLGVKISRNNNRLFARYRFLFECGNFKQNFHQIQIGCSINIFGKNKTN